MLIKVSGNKERLQDFCDAFGAKVEYYANENVGKCYVYTEEHTDGEHDQLEAEILDLSHCFRIVVHDGGHGTFRSVELLDGRWRVLDEGWELEGARFYHVRNGAEVSEVEERPDYDDYLTEQLYKHKGSQFPSDDECSGLWKAMTKECCDAPLILVPHKPEVVDWAKEGF
jgi:hypothetical protein